MPNDGRDRAPLPEQQGERQAGEQHIGAAFDRFRHVSRPPVLELSARHDAVLHGEQRHQENVHDERFSRCRAGACIDRLWHYQVRYEADGVKECKEEYEIGGEAIEKCDEPACRFSRISGLIACRCVTASSDRMRARECC